MINICRTNTATLYPETKNKKNPFEILTETVVSDLISSHKCICKYFLLLSAINAIPNEKKITENSVARWRLSKVTNQKQLYSAKCKLFM